LFFIGWALAILSGVIYTHFPDTTQILEIGLQILFYVTPIIHNREIVARRNYKLAILVDWNPLTALLALIRTPILEGTLPDTGDILMSFSFLAVVGFLAVVLLRKLERTLIFWI
jgi:lipopolysaccharide transport system permease protein